MFAIPTPSTANARQQQFWEMLEEDFEAALWRLILSMRKTRRGFAAAFAERRMSCQNLVVKISSVSTSLSSAQLGLRWNFKPAQSELWISRVKGTASMRRKFLSFLSFRTKVEDLIAQAGIKAPVLPGHRPRVFPWFEGKAMVSWKHMAHEAINIYTSAWIIILMDLGRHNKVGSGRNRQCRVGWKGCGRASLCRALSEARFGWIRVQKFRSGRCVLARYRASWQTFWRWI